MPSEHGQRVLILGIDPSSVPGIDAEQINAGLAAGLSRFEGTGLRAVQCLVALDESAERTITDCLAAAPFDCVVVGGGIRKPEPLLEFFEVVVNLIRRHAPQAAIAFNRNGGDSLDAALRVLRPGPARSEGETL